MITNLEKIEERFRELEAELIKPDATKDMARFRKLSKEHNDLRETVAVIAEYKKASCDLAEHRQIVKTGEDPDLLDLAKAEIPELEQRVEALTRSLRALLVPKDPNDGKAVIMEIRAGTGGEEAAIFAGDLFRMYTRFAERRGWKTDLMNSSASDKGGFKEIIFLVDGAGAYGDLKYENGVHRVQRVPVTEAQGRIHTSAASVVVMPEADEVEVRIGPQDLRIDVFRSSGPGGQSVNTTDSAVRITHVPTGLVVSCQDEKSQHKNKAKALKVLQARLLDAETEKKSRAESAVRKRIVGTGDRSAKIRTYNYPQGRMTEHRIGLTLYRLDDIMDGNIQDILRALKKAEIDEKMSEAGKQAG
jgi:peptide chain release factor 1